LNVSGQLWRSSNIAILSRVNAFLPVRAKEKTLCAPHEPQKVLVVEPYLVALPDEPDVQLSDIVLTASPDH